MTRIRFAVLVGLLAAFVLGPATAAFASSASSASSASLGSVPADVATYVSDGSMVARLNDIYGKNAAGTAGISFDATTQAGPISRVYEWTADRLANTKTDHPVQLTNNWVVPITIGGKPVGLATIWINPQNVAAELAQFDPTPALATALASVPADAALVRDPTTHAWLALAGGTVTPLVAGTSGLTAPEPVSSLKLSSSAPVVASSDPNTGIAVAIVVVALVVVILLVVLFIPRGRKRAGAHDTVDAVVAVDAVPAEDAVAAEDAAPAAIAPEAAPVSRAAPVPDAGAPRTRAPRSTPGTSVTPGTPVTKRATSKPRSGTAPAAAASTRPRVQKPPAQKPPAAQPPAQPPAAKPPTAQPKPNPKPTGDPDGSSPDA